MQSCEVPAALFFPLIGEALIFDPMDRRKPLEILDQNSLPMLPGYVRLAWSRMDAEGGQDGLSGEEHEEMASLGSVRRRREYGMSRMLIRRLAGTAGMEPAELRILREEGGRPYGEYRGRRVHLSLTHTDRRIACVLSGDGQVGLDMEPEGRRVHAHLRSRMMHPGEVKPMESVDTLRIWTLKEAMLKLQGRGLRTNMNEVCLSPDGEGRFEAIFNNEMRAKICSFTHDGHWVALAYFI